MCGTWPFLDISVGLTLKPGTKNNLNSVGQTLRSPHLLPWHALVLFCLSSPLTTNFEDKQISIFTHCPYSLPQPYFFFSRELQ